MSFLLLIHPTNGNFLKQPSIEWIYNIPGSGTLSGRNLRHGNEVITSQNGQYLFVTADDGSLHILDTSNPNKNSLMYIPTETRGAYTECRSGITIVEDNEGNPEYVIYSVIDVPVRATVLYNGLEVDSSRTNTISRIIAVNVKDGNLRWSLPMNGIIIGKPMINHDATKLYVVHNVPSSSGGRGDLRGTISVLLLRGNNEPPVITAALSSVDRPRPLGPPTGQTITIEEKDGNNVKYQDVLVVAEAQDNGYNTEQGRLYMFMPSTLHNEFNGQGNDAYTLRVINEIDLMSTIARPTITKDASQVFVGAVNAKLMGWTGKEENTITKVWKTDGEGTTTTDIKPAWITSLEPAKGNASQRT